MKYGKHMQKHKIEGWESYYLDYKKLKKFIRFLINTDQVQTDLPAAKAQFFVKLDQELETVGSFYSRIELKLKTRDDFLEAKQAELDTLISEKNPKSQHLIILLEEAWDQLQTELDKLQNFAEINSTGVSKIVKKWDKQTRSATKQLYLERQAVIQPWFDRLSITKLADNVAKGLLDLNRTKSRFFARYNSPMPDIFNSAIGLSDTPSAEDLFNCCANNHERAQIAIQVLNDTTISPSTVEFIIKHVSEKLIDLSWVDQVSGRSILHASARAGILSIVEAATKMGADPNCVDSYGCYPIYYAVVGGYFSIVKNLLQHSSELDINSQGIRSLQLAASLGNFETFYTLLTQTTTEWSNQDMVAALFKCSEKGDWKTADALFDQGLDVVNALNDLNQSALHITCMNGHLIMSEWLIKMGASVGLKDKDSNWTPLFFAANEGFTSIVKLLLENNSNPLDVDDRGYSPAFFAAYQGHMECAKLLSITSIPRIDSKFEPYSYEDSFIPSLELPPPVIPLQITKRSDNSDKALVIIRFYSEARKAHSLVKFIRHIQLNSLRLQVSAQSSSSLLSHTIQLPLQERSKYLHFEVSRSIPFNFEFLLFPSFGSAIVGKAMLSNQLFGLESGLNVKLPLIGSDMDVVAELSFDFLVINPLAATVDKSLGSFSNIWDNLDIDPTKNSQNKYLAVDVQVTRDGAPVVYSPKTIKITENVELPVDQLYLSQIKSIVKSSLPNANSAFPVTAFSANSVYSETGDGTLLRKYIAQACIPLDQFLLELPEDIALVISMVLPSEQSQDYMLNKFVDAILSTIFTSSVKLRGTANTQPQPQPSVGSKSSGAENGISGSRKDGDIFYLEGMVNRSIFLSSSSPAACLLAQWKQPVYPVILDIHSDSPSSTMPTLNHRNCDGFAWDPSIKSLKSACKFSSAEELFGITVDSSLLNLVPSLTQAFTDYNLFLVQNVPDPSVDFTESLSYLATDAHLKSNIMYLKSPLS